MNALKQLQVEYDGICGTIHAYTTDSNVLNYLDKLKIGIDKLDYDIVKYSLEQIILWYDNSIIRICNSKYAKHTESHIKNHEFLKKIYERLQPEDFIANTYNTKSEDDNKNLIFLSHRSSDKIYGHALRDYLVGLGIKNNQLIYTSHPMHKIPMDENIYDYLRENINSKIFMIILWSDAYLESPACLNEMGAAWVAQSDYTNIYVPTFSFGNPKYHECAVDTRKMGAVLNGDEHCKASMIEFKNKVQELFKLEKDEQNEAYLLDEFIKEITKE